MYHIKNSFAVVGDFNDMKVTKALGRIIKPLVNFPRWMGVQKIRENGRAIVKMIKDMRIYRPTVRQESFEEAMIRMHLSEEDIKARMKTCLILSIVYSCCTLLFLIYTVYMVWHGHLGMILGFLVTILVAVFAYREHFWYFQMKTRTLGRTFKEWASFLLKGARND